MLDTYLVIKVSYDKILSTFNALKREKLCNKYSLMDDSQINVGFF